MAETLKIPAPGAAGATAAIPLLEDAVRLLRAAPAGVIVKHWIGSVPLALGVLWFWNTITNPRTSDAAIAAQALGLAVLLVWMNCWRAVFAGRLRRELNGAPDPSWTTRRVRQLIGGQSFLGATKLIVMPVAALIIFPLADAVAFYRTAAVLSGDGDFDPRQMMRRARQLATIEPRQSWTALTILVFLQLLAGVNVAIALWLLPRLIRMLTGYESSFSRSGIYFIETPLFWLLVMALTWLGFDPFAQTAYCVRTFRAESLETGEDLRTGLRRLRRITPVFAVLLLAIVIPASAEISKQDLETSIRQTMQSHIYDWRLPPPSAAASGKSWFGSILDGIARGLRSVFDWAGDALERFVRWLGKQLAGSSPSAGALPGRALHWSVYAITGAVIAAALIVLWRRQRARRKQERPQTGEVRAAIRLEDENVSPDQLPEESWIELAERCIAEANLRLALRALFLSSLAALGRRQFLSIHPGKTNQEYERELRRRARAFPVVSGFFADNVAVFERAWYGMHEVSQDDIRIFRRHMSEIRSALEPAA